MNSEKQTLVTCPTCKSKLVYSVENPYRPFCSERCQMIDLGAWADEQYRIPLQSQPQHHDTSSVNSPAGSSEDDDSF